MCGTGESTCFPVTMCRGASFDVELEEEIGHAIGREVRGHGGNCLPAYVLICLIIQAGDAARRSTGKTASHWDIWERRW